MLERFEVRLFASRRFWVLRAAVQKWRARAHLITLRPRPTSSRRALAGLAAGAIVRVIMAVAMTALVVVITQLGPRFIDELAAQVKGFGWLHRVARWLAKGPPASGSGVQPVLSAALGVCGTLAGVYFATVAFVVSSTYKDASVRVRQLVVRLPGARLYTFMYVQAVLFALVVLGLSFAGAAPTRATMLVAAALGAFVVLSFSRLRTQLYALLEPVSLLPVLRQDIARHLRLAAVVADNDPTTSRTTRARERFADALSTLADLCTLVIERERPANPAITATEAIDPRVVEIAYEVVFTWARYASTKPGLVNASGWLTTTHEHQDWLLASEFEVTMALKTGTTLSPRAVPHHLWVEEHLADLLAEIMANRSVPGLALLLRSMGDLTQALAAYGMFAENRLWIETLSTPARLAIQAGTATATTSTSADALSSTDAADAAPTAEQEPHGTRNDRRITEAESALVDTVAAAYVASVLGLGQYLTHLMNDFPAWTVAEVRGKKTRSLGSTPTAMIENLRDALAFEQAVEGRVITSDANIQQLVARAVAIDAIDETTTLLTAFETEFLPWTLAIAEQGTASAAPALARLTEAIHKLERPLHTLHTLYEACQAVYRDHDDNWPILDRDALTARVRAVAAALPAPIADLATKLPTSVHPDLPDNFGWAYRVTGDGLFREALEPSGTTASELDARIRALVQTTDKAAGRIRSTIRRQPAKVTGSFSAEPYLLLLQLSGVASVIGHVTGDHSVASAFEREWQQLISAQPQVVLDITVDALAADRNLFALTPGGIFRSERELRAFDRLRTLGVHSGPFDTTPAASRSNLTPQAQKLLRHVGGISHFEDIYFGAFVVPMARSHGADLTNDPGPAINGIINDFTGTP